METVVFDKNGSLERLMNLFSSHLKSCGEMIQKQELQILDLMKRVDDSSMKLSNSMALLVKQSQVHREQIPGIEALNQEAFKCKNTYQGQGKILLDLQGKLPPELRILESEEMRSKFPHLSRRLDLIVTETNTMQSNSERRDG